MKILLFIFFLKKYVYILYIYITNINITTYSSSGERMAHLEFGQDRLAQPHPLQAFELGEALDRKTVSLSDSTRRLRNRRKSS